MVQRSHPPFVSKQCLLVVVVWGMLPSWLVFKLMLCLLCSDMHQAGVITAGPRSFNYASEFNLKLAKSNSKMVASTTSYHYNLCKAGVMNFSANGCFLDECLSRSLVTELVVKSFTN